MMKKLSEKKLVYHESYKRLSLLPKDKSSGVDYTKAPADRNVPGTKDRIWLGAST